MRIGVLCPSEIAYRRFLPALGGIEGAEMVGVGVNTPQERYGDSLPDEGTIKCMLEDERAKAGRMISEYGGRLFNGYERMLCSPEIDAIYIPLPPALHHRWAKMALLHGKHVLVEKPSTTSCADTKDLVDTAREKGLALHENYMFAFHSQLDAIDSIVASGELGDVRLYRICFGFPRRAPNDFRYNKALGGGALIDAGGYVMKYASRLLGDTATLRYAQLNYLEGFEVDIYGSAAMVNRDGVTAQLAFGMDNDYKCELEVWGSKGTLRTNRVLTAPADFVPSATIKKNTDIEECTLPADDAFRKSIAHFMRCIDAPKVREANYADILGQARLVDEFIRLSGGETAV